jgi:hypothetical protein
MFDLLAMETLQWIASGEAWFRMLLAVLVLIVLWEVAALIAVLIGLASSQGTSRGGVRPNH